MEKRNENAVIQIIDYGMGNLRSVAKAFERIGVAARFCTDPEELTTATAAVLPGVGAFRDAIGQLQQTGFDAAIRDYVKGDRPLLGICLGLQLLFEESDEDGRHKGLGVCGGRVERFESQPGLKIPHMGWNTVRVASDHPVMSNVPDAEHFYFVHSYFVRPSDESIVALTCEHGEQFCAAIARGNVVATQFHPEKSQDAGRRLLESFVKTFRLTR